MGEKLRPGQRLIVTTKGGAAIGLGTFLWSNQILLDRGTKILTEHCIYECTDPSAVPPFDIDLRAEARVFEGDGHLHKTGNWLRVGHQLTIEEVALKGWNHGDYVAGKFHYRGKQYWLIMFDIVIAWEPHLRLVV